MSIPFGHMATELGVDFFLLCEQVISDTDGNQTEF